jgi:hypothetical protein
VYHVDQLKAGFVSRTGRKCDTCKALASNMVFGELAVLAGHPILYRELIWLAVAAPLFGVALCDRFRFNAIFLPLLLQQEATLVRQRRYVTICPETLVPSPSLGGHIEL